jgi:hypothetical protein
MSTHDASIVARAPEVGRKLRVQARAARTMRTADGRAPVARLARSRLKPDKPPMATRHTELDALRPLVAELARHAARSDAAWRGLADPRLLRGFRRDLDSLSGSLAQAEPTAFALDAMRTVCAEIMVAQRLLDAGCAIEREAATPSGKRVDFLARRDGAALHVHVKRAPQPAQRDAAIVVPQAWRSLEQVRRGLVVALSLARNLRGRALQHALAEAFPFLEQASIGEELSIKDEENRTVARLRVIAPSAAGTTELVADLAAAFDNHVPRFQNALRKAFTQFMPRGENIIVVCGSSGAVEPFATALLGSHIERWDKRPRVGELVAYGRGGDGFWAGAMRNQSRMAVYWPMTRGSGPLLFLREGAVRAGTSKAVGLARSIFA